MSLFPPSASSVAEVVLGRRRFLGRLLAAFGLATLAGGRAARAASTAPGEGQVWMCTFRDCEPYFYVPWKGDTENVNGDHPIPAGTTFEELPDDWICPVCGSDKSYFIKVKGDGDPERA